VKVTVFGATGKVGRLVIANLLAGGHEVVAYVRNPAKLDIADPRLLVVAGELSDPSRVRESIHGADAVISALGPSMNRSTKGTPVTEGTRNIVAAMEAEHVALCALAFSAATRWDRRCLAPTSPPSSSLNSPTTRTRGQPRQ
jgi:putative NADH-flavin reductase